MLVESIVRRTLGIKNHVVTGVMAEEDGLLIELDLWKRRRLPCGTCGCLSRVRDRLRERDWKHVPLWGIPTKVRYRPARVWCEKCAKIRVEEIPWGQGKCRLSRGLIGFVGTWTKLLAWDVVAKLVGVHWNTVAAAVRQSVAYGRKHQQLGSVVYIGMDELSRRKGHVYVTNVYDLREKGAAGRPSKPFSLSTGRFSSIWSGECVATCGDRTLR